MKQTTVLCISVAINVALSIILLSEIGIIKFESNNGEYRYVGEDKIILYVEGRNNEQVFDTFLHELGHKVYYQDLNESQREEYKEIYENQTKFISNYAKTEVEEGFAEDLMYYFQRAYSYDMDDARYKLFDEVINDSFVRLGR